jgi:hypothetical protein
MSTVIQPRLNRYFDVTNSFTDGTDKATDTPQATNASALASHWRVPCTPVACCGARVKPRPSKTATMPRW